MQQSHYELIIEIIIKEKQRAVGIQPMLYFAFPVSELVNGNELIGRLAETKEESGFEFNEKNIFIILEMIKIFGILSKAHKEDVIAMLKRILE